MKRNKEETTETINKIIDVARSYFTKHGYADSTLEDIANEAELTRGSIYHHFRNKKGLFHVVLESVQKEVAERIETEAAKSDDVWEQLLLGCRAFVAAAVEPQNKRVMLIDGPAVLGWETWRIMDEHNSMRLLRGQLQIMEQQGCLKPVSIDAMTHCLSGSLNESALWITQMPDYQQSLEATMRVISHMLTGFKSETVIEE
ncbi:MULTISPECIES: TetR/AcrR family transcriptional regulator [unclassified Paenibacillus]|uniref:TetR/AcrR family transcriptional regulator n=1 Tax=unclassified Paenibacillus TaxID=185978 RepID=UPI00364066A2